MSDLHYDLCIIGGGINGAAIARDAAGRGLTVLLVESQDLAGATSSASTKLIHGGLRYLEQWDFALVKKSLREREILLRNAPNLIWPIRCVIPNSELVKRPAWMIRLGLFLYDRLGGKSVLPPSRSIDRTQDDYIQPLKSEYMEGYVYSDCWCDDTRLVILNALQATDRGARILNYTKCIGLVQEEGRWNVDLLDTRSQDRLNVSASMVVNATGPWVNQFLESVKLGLRDPDLPKTRMVKGSHLIIKRHYKGEQTYLLQQPDGRVVFVAPYEGRYTLIGTTEEDYYSDPRDAMISEDETAYLCAAFNLYFDEEVKPSDAVFTYSGVRPLLYDGEGNSSQVSRDHLIYRHARFTAPLLSIFGGKLTTHRVVAEEVVDELMQLSGRHSPAWTAQEPLIGVDVGKYGWLPPELLTRYRSSYGDLVVKLIKDAECLSDLGRHYGDGVYEAELDYLTAYEWATSVDDVIWRRSKLGLWISEQTIDAIEGYFSAENPSD